MVWPIYCLAFLVLHGFGLEMDSDIMSREPDDITVVEGESARLQCHIQNLDIKHTVRWSVNGIIYGPWQASYHRGSYSYPKDGDTSQGIYDMVIDPVIWRKHGGSTFECQVSQPRQRSRVATLTVRVPPTHVDISPIPTDGLVVIDDTSETANISCGLNYAPPGSKIRWQSDENPREGTVSVEYITNANSEKLEQVLSTIVLSRKKLNHSAVPLLMSYQPIGPKGDELIERRVLLEERYETVYHVTCQVYHHTVEENITNSSWIVFEPMVSAVGNMAAVPLWIVTGLICGLAAIAIFIAGCVLLRSRRRATTIRRSTDIVTFITDQGLCSNTASDRQSDISTLRPSGENENIHMLHGQTEETGSDPFDHGDCKTIPNPGISREELGQNSIASSSQSTRGSYMTSPRRRPHDLAALTPTHFEENTYSLPRFNAISRRSNVPMNSEGAGENTGQLPTFASLPRYAPLYPRSSKQALTTFCVTARATGDSLPPPPTPPLESPSHDGAYLPPPMSMLDKYTANIKYNLVSRGNNFNTGRINEEGMSDQSPNSASSGPNFLRALPGSLV